MTAAVLGYEDRKNGLAYCGLCVSATLAGRAGWPAVVDGRDDILFCDRCGEPLSVAAPTSADLDRQAERLRGYSFEGSPAEVLAERQRNSGLEDAMSSRGWRVEPMVCGILGSGNHRLVYSVECEG